MRPIVFSTPESSRFKNKKACESLLKKEPCKRSTTVVNTADSSGDEVTTIQELDAVPAFGMADDLLGNQMKELEESQQEMDNGYVKCDFIGASTSICDFIGASTSTCECLGSKKDAAIP